MLQVKQAKSADTQFYGVHIPMGALYLIAPEMVRHGVVYPRTYVWITRAPIQGGGISAYTMTRENPYPRQMYFRADHPFTRAFYFYCCGEGIVELSCKPVITRKQAESLAPRDRTIGKYISRAVPGYEHRSRFNVTDKSVVDGCRVGNHFYSEVGYTSEVMKARW